MKKCVICKEVFDNKDDDQICDACAETRDEVSNGKGDDEDD